MDVRPAVHRDDRRRRVLADEAAAAATVSRAARRDREDAPRYASAAQPHRQRPITDLVPVRIRWHVLAWVLALAAIGTLVAAYYATRLPGAVFTPQTLAAIDLAAGDSLAGWFRSAVLALAAGVALLVYIIRRHKQDDYRGRYRIWLWAAGCWILASTQATAGWMEAFAGLMVGLTHWAGPYDGIAWRLAPVALVLTPVAVRLLLDMRDSRLSAALFATGGAMWIAVVLFQEGILSIANPHVQTMAQAALAMSGDLCVLSAMAWHARFVLLDAQGGLSPRKRKRTSSANDSEARTNGAASSSMTPRTELASKTASQTSPPATTIPMSVRSLNLATRPATPANDRSDMADHRLSRAERRRLKREQRRAA
jgi:hypothetical protein